MSLEEKEKELYGMSAKGDGQIVDLNALREEAAPKQEEEPESAWGFNKPKITDFEEETSSKVASKVGFFTKFAFWILIAAVLVGGGFLYYFISQYSKSKDLALDVKAPGKIMVAKPFEISVDVENKSQNILKQAKISIKLPDGVISLDNKNPDIQTYEEAVGDLNSQAIVRKKYKAVILKDEQSIKKFDIVFSYIPENLNTRFEKAKTIEITAEQSAIAVNLTTPQKVFNGEIFEMGVSYQNLSDFDFENARLQVVYPNGFTFKESSTSSSVSNNIWKFDRVSKNDGEKNISIKGSLRGADQSFFEIKSQFFAVFNQREYVISEKSANLSIASSPISLAIVANNSPEYISAQGDNLNYQVSYRNNTDVGLTDVVIKLKLSGEMYDFKTLQSNGSFDSINNTITWNAGNIPEFKLLPQNAQGTVSFNIMTKQEYPIKRMFDKNFILKVSGEINSPTVPYNVSSDKTFGLASLETKVRGYAELNAVLETLKGPNPPKVNKPTTYNVKLVIKNYSTDIKDIKVTTLLQSGVKWLNVVKSNSDTIPLYNERTGEVEWQIPKMPATKGVIGIPLEASFQVEGTPNITQAGQQFLILGQTTFNATDEFTNLPMTGKTDVLKTAQNAVN